VWWCKYWVGGRVIRQSTGTTNRVEAKRFLDARVGRVAEGAGLRVALGHYTLALLLSYSRLREAEIVNQGEGRAARA
jgi:hypothetical protein